MMSIRKTYERILCQRWCYLLLVLLLLLPLINTARADGGVVLCRRKATPFDITVFSAEMPLRPGPADLSVLVEQTQEHSPILNAQVLIELEHEAGVIIRTEATRSQARNKLLYCSLLTLPKAGHWKMMLHVVRGNEKADMLYDLVVTELPPVLISNWTLISLPPLVIILFLFNQSLRRKTSTGERA